MEMILCILVVSKIFNIGVIVDDVRKEPRLILNEFRPIHNSELSLAILENFNHIPICDRIDHRTKVKPQG